MYGNDRVMYSYVARCVLASLPLRGVGGRTGFMARAPLVGRGESWAASYPWACSQSSGIFVCGQKGKGQNRFRSSSCLVASAGSLSVRLFQFLVDIGGKGFTMA